jgi:hypothetical protein
MEEKEEEEEEEKEGGKGRARRGKATVYCERCPTGICTAPAMALIFLGSSSK